VGRLQSQIKCAISPLEALGILTINRFDIRMRIEGGEDADLVLALVTQPIPALLLVVFDVVDFADIILCSTIDFHQVILFEATGIADGERCVFNFVQERPPEATAFRG